MLPKAPRANVHHAPMFQVGALVLPVTVENPEAKIKLASALFRTTDKYRNMDDYVYEVTEGFAEMVTDYQSLFNFRKLFENPIMYPHPASPIKSMGQTNLWSQLHQVLYANESPSAMMDAVEPEIQAVLDDIFN